MVLGWKIGDRENNFDLIRLLASAQVVLWHGIEHLKIRAPSEVLWLLATIPGVPIFFFISGYLVTASFRRSATLSLYFQNRARRIFPGLWVCFMFCFVSIVWIRGLSNISMTDLWKWIVPNIIGFSHTPQFLRDFGTGSVNGSLWSIPVELQFYLVLPILVAALGRSVPRWILVFSFFLLCSEVYTRFVRSGDSLVLASVMLRALPSWLYMFMLGMILEARRDWVQRYMVNRLRIWISAYLVWALVLQAVGINTLGNTASPLLLIPLAGVVMSAAYSNPLLAGQLLHHQDVSYGVYLYHIPIINLLVETMPELRDVKGLAICVVLTGGAAVVSWRWIEKPFLRRKLKSDSVSKS